MYYFLVNKTSGKNSAKDITGTIRKLCEAAGAEYRIYSTGYEGRTDELCGKIEGMDDPDKKVIIAGGDGTINVAVNAFADLSRIKLGIIPRGSGNDFLRGLKITGTPEEILGCILENDSYTPVDIGKVTLDETKSRLFAVSSGFGLDAIVCNKVDSSKLKKFLNIFHLGSLAYTIKTVTTLFSMRTFTASVKNDNGEFKVNKVIYSAQMNTPYEGGGVPMAPSASAADGKLSVCMGAGVAKIKTFFFLPLLVKAKHEKLKCFRLFDSSRIHYELSEPVAVHTDGEYLGEFSDISYEILPGKLKLLNPL